MDECGMTTDPILAEDLAFVAKSECIEWDRFRGKTVLVTGATGYLGSLMVKALQTAELSRHLDLRILADARNPEKARDVLGGPLSYDNVRLVLDACSCPARIGEHVDFIVHTAAVTASKMMVEQPYETILVTLKGTENMLELAKAEKINGMVYLSSMEVYGVPSPDKIEMTEDRLGFINPLLPRSSYPESKRMAEGLCAAAAGQYGIPVRIARLAQTFGAGISPNETRVFAQFARAIIAGKDIVLKTDGSKAHCYCYSRDALVALLMLLTKGVSGEAYNVSNEDTFCSIREMAERLVVTHPKCGSKLVFDLPQGASALGYPPSARIKVMSGKMRDLGWKSEVGLDEMYDRLMASMRNEGIS